MSQQQHFYSTQYPSQQSTQYPTQYSSQYPTQYSSQYSTQSPTQYPSQQPTQYPTQYSSQSPTQYSSQYPQGYAQMGAPPIGYPPSPQGGYANYSSFDYSGGLAQPSAQRDPLFGAFEDLMNSSYSIDLSSPQYGAPSSSLPQSEAQSYSGNQGTTLSGSPEPTSLVNTSTSNPPCYGVPIRIKSRLPHGFVFDAKAGGGRMVVLCPQNGSSEDDQRFVYTVEGYIEVKGQPNLVLDVEPPASSLFGKSKDDQGCRVILTPKRQFECDSQKWTYDDGWIRCRRNNLVCEVKAGSTLKGAQIIVSSRKYDPKEDSTHQRFDFI